MAYSPRLVANYFIGESRRKGDIPPTPMQLLKLVYIAHGWSLAINDRPLIVESIEAWLYGPVIPSLYRSLKQWRNRPVDEFLPIAPTEQTDFLPEDKEVMDAVLDAYGHLSALQLSSLTHASGTPWHEVYKVEGQNMGDALIPSERIKQHFVDLANSRRHAN